MMFLKQSTAVDLPLGPFVDDTDGKTAETALTLTQPDIRLKKNGSNWAQKNASQTLSHEENGWYEVSLNATDTDTLGHLMIAVHEAGALPVWREFLVVPAAVYEMLVGGSTSIEVAQADVTAGLNIVQKVLWLFQRFFNETKRNSNTEVLTVAKGDGTVASTQAISDSGGIQTVAKAA